MLRFQSFVRNFTHIAMLLPIALPVVGCSDNTSGGAGGAGGSSEVPDTTPPTVLSTFPADSRTSEATRTTIRVEFSEAMAPSSLNAQSFVVTQGATVITGERTNYHNTAIFSPATNLELDTLYTATVTTAATDMAGNALESNHVWTFRTDKTAPIGPAPVGLGAAGEYVILAKSEVSNVPTSAVTGNIGLSPAAASYITGFSLTRVGTHWTSHQVTGSIFAADNDPPTPINLTTAVSNMLTAYTDAAGRPTPDGLNLGAGTIGGMTFLPGLYKWTSSVVIPTDITFAGAPNDTWILQISGDLSLSAAKAITLSGGAQPKNIVWQVAGEVMFGSTSHAEGVFFSKKAIKLGTGASVVGRLYAQTAVNLQSSTVTAPAP